MSKITFLGLGAMGSRMAINYARAGHDVTVWNRTRTVAEELAGAPNAVRRLRDAALAKSIPFVEAPVVGSRPQAEAGALSYLLGGDPTGIDAVQPIIDVNAGNSKHVGQVGNAAILKLAINGLFASQVAAYAEVIGFIERNDLDTHEAIETLTALPITSPALQRILGLIRNRNYEPNFPIHLVAKDLRYLTTTAEDIGAPLPIIAATHALFDRATTGEHRDLDIAGIARTYRTVSLEVDPVWRTPTSRGAG